MSGKGKAGKKTQSSFLGDKVALRVGHLPDKWQINVLDAYAGTGVIWKAVNRQWEKRERGKITVLPIDHNPYMGTFHVPGDNLAIMRKLDLDKFQVIDLDAYGIPYAQIRLLFDRQYRGVVYVTFIQSMYGAMPVGLLREVGFSDDILKKAYQFCGKRGFEYFLQWLALRGVKRVWHRGQGRKHYLGFDMGDVEFQVPKNAAPRIEDYDTREVGTLGDPV